MKVLQGLIVRYSGLRALCLLGLVFSCSTYGLEGYRHTDSPSSSCYVSKKIACETARPPPRYNAQGEAFPYYFANYPSSGFCYFSKVPHGQYGHDMSANRLKTGGSLLSCDVNCPDGQDRFDGICVKSRRKQTGKPQTCVGNPIDPGLGNKFQIEDDFRSLTMNGLSLTRTYNQMVSYVPAPVGFRWGVGWTGTYDRIIITNGSRRVAYRPDGTAFNFFYSGAVSSWVADADVNAKLEQLPSSAGWRYTDNTSDEVEMYDNSGKLLSIASRNGYTQTMGYSSGSEYILDAYGNPTGARLSPGLQISVTDSNGRSTHFGYDVYGRVVKVTDSSSRSYLYTYDLVNKLTSVRYPDNRVRTYVYNEIENTSNVPLKNALTGIIDEKGNRFATFQYDASGRSIVSQHNLTDGVEVSPVEKVSVAYTIDGNGDVISSLVIDAINSDRNYVFNTILGVSKSAGLSKQCSNCGGDINNTKTFDANGNTSSILDFNGNVSSYSYNLSRNLEVSRIEATGASVERVVATTWHPNFRLPLTITEPGKVTSFTYDANGNLLSQSVASVP